MVVGHGFIEKPCVLDRGYLCRKVGNEQVVEC